VSLTLLPGYKDQVSFTDKHIIFIYRAHIVNYKLLPRQKRHPDTFGQLRDLFTATGALKIGTV
jgi:hypothetical protein